MSSDETAAAAGHPGGGAGAPVVGYRLDTGVATITLQRPEAMNSLDRATKEQLLRAVRRAAEDPGVRCVVLTGTGRAFCTGQDLKEHAAILAADAATPEAERQPRLSTVEEHYNPLVTLLATMPKPVLAAVNGVAAGAGASLALACDLRVVGESGGFNLAFAGVGLSCDTGSSWTLPRLVGGPAALELMYFPRTVGAEESLTLGLATKVVPDDRLAEEVAALAARLAAGPTVAYGAIRRSVAYSAGHDLADSLAHEATMMALTGDTSDHQRAVTSFLTKQRPVFEGR